MMEFEIEVAEEDEAADDLTAQSLAFLDTIRRAREDKAQGRVRQLAELRAKYGDDEATPSGNGS